MAADGTPSGLGAQAGDPGSGEIDGACYIIIYSQADPPEGPTMTSDTTAFRARSAASVR